MPKREKPIEDRGPMPPLKWSPDSGYSLVAQLGNKDDGANFLVTYHPTCYRRGPFRLLVTVCHGDNHELWGCFDDADQPMRNYHDGRALIIEANMIASVLWADRFAYSREQRHALYDVVLKNCPDVSALVAFAELQARTIPTVDSLLLGIRDSKMRGRGETPPTGDKH